MAQDNVKLTYEAIDAIKKQDAGHVGALHGKRLLATVA
jgi:hypothetical protein